MADAENNPQHIDTEEDVEQAKRKEEEEQSKLPYKWTQTIQDLDITIQIPANLRGKDCDVKIGKTTIKAGIKGQEPVLEVGGV